MLRAVQQRRSARFDVGGDLMSQPHALRYYVAMSQTQDPSPRFANTDQRQQATSSVGWLGGTVHTTRKRST